MKNGIIKIVKGFGIGGVAIVLVTLGIDASDHYDNLSESIAGRVLFGEQAPCPEDMIFIPSENNGFCIDKYEASPGDKCDAEKINSQRDTKTNIDDADCFPVSVVDAEPWRFVSQSQAAIACAKAGKRLPSNEEWYLASLGTPDPNSGWGTDDCQVNKNWQSQPGLTGSGKNCVSAAGAYDMIGNVWEWVKGEVRHGKHKEEMMPDDGYIVSVDSEGIALKTDGNTADENYNNDYLWVKKDGVRAIARGGGWGNESDAGMYAMYITADPSFAGSGIGFRCVK